MCPIKELEPLTNDEDSDITTTMEDVDDNTPSPEHYEGLHMPEHVFETYTPNFGVDSSNLEDLSAHISDIPWPSEPESHHANFEYWRDALNSAGEEAIRMFANILYNMSFRDESTVVEYVARAMTEVHFRISGSYDSEIGEHILVPVYQQSSAGSPNEDRVE